MSQDPAFWQIPQAYLLDPQLQNSYSYARNNPVRLVDETGEIPVDTVLDAGFFVYDFGNFLSAFGNSTYYLAQAGFGALTGNESLKNEGWSNFVANDENLSGAITDLAIDAGGTLTPYVPVAAIKGAIKGGKEIVENVVKYGDEAAKVSSNITPVLKTGQNVEGLGKVVDNKPGKISGFTTQDGGTHGLDQVINRGIKPSDLQDTVKKPLVTFKQNRGRTLYLSDKAGVVLDSKGVVITAYNKFKSHVSRILNMFKQK